MSRGQCLNCYQPPKQWVIWPQNPRHGFQSLVTILLSSDVTDIWFYYYCASKFAFLLQVQSQQDCLSFPSRMQMRSWSPICNLQEKTEAQFGEVIFQKAQRSEVLEYRSYPSHVRRSVTWVWHVYKMHCLCILQLQLYRFATWVQVTLLRA